MGPELRVTSYLLTVRPVSVLGNLCMCLNFLSVGCFISRAIPKCGKNRKLAKIVTGSTLSWPLSCMSLHSYSVLDLCLH